MKTIYIITCILLSTLLFGQKIDCKHVITETDSIGVLKQMPDYLMYEKKFGNKEEYLFLSLASLNDTPFLKFQLIQKNSDFIKAFCLDQSSRLYLQLNNGKIVTLVHTSEDICGTLINLQDDKKYSRVTSANFLFLKGSMEELMESPVYLIRVKNTTDNIDYIIKSNFTSELTQTEQFPETFFIENLPCF